jgi:glycerol uptake facilitator-like aquaporin
MLHRFLVEFIGMVLYAYIAISTGNPLAIGATLAFVLLLTSPFSQGGLNPATTIVYSVMGKIDTGDIIPYCLAQITGALVAFQLYKRVST